MPESPLHSLAIPEFSLYIRTPHEVTAKKIECNRLIVEILGCQQSASEEFYRQKNDSVTQKITFEEDRGKKALLLRYRTSPTTEGKSTYTPVYSMNFDIDEEKKEVVLSQLQGIKNKKYGYRVNAGFDVLKFYLHCIEENFFQKGYQVRTDFSLEDNDGIKHGAHSLYYTLGVHISRLQQKYFPDTPLGK